MTVPSIFQKLDMTILTSSILAQILSLHIDITLITDKSR